MVSLLRMAAVAVVAAAFALTAAAAVAGMNGEITGCEIQGSWLNASHRLDVSNLEFAVKQSSVISAVHSMNNFVMCKFCSFLTACASLGDAKWNCAGGGLIHRFSIPESPLLFLASIRWPSCGSWNCLAMVVGLCLYALTVRSMFSRRKVVRPALWVGKRRYTIASALSRRSWFSIAYLLLFALCVAPVLLCSLPARFCKLVVRICLPSVPAKGLNGLMRGGASNASQGLLKGLQELLSQFEATAKPTKARPQRNDTKDEAVEQHLLHALQTLVARASQKLEGLLQRLQSLVASAADGKLRGPSKSKKRARRRARAAGSERKDVSPSPPARSSSPITPPSRRAKLGSDKLPLTQKVNSNGVMWCEAGPQPKHPLPKKLIPSRLEFR